MKPRGINVQSTTINVEYELKRIAHNRSGFDSCNILKNLPTWRRLVRPIKTAKTLITVKNLSGFCNLEKITEENSINICVLHDEHSKRIFRNIRRTFCLQQGLLKRRSFGS